MTIMCFNCGCHIPDDDMGHPDNITISTFQALGKKVGKNLHDTQHLVHDYLEAQTNDPEAAKNADIEEMFFKASKAWGQSLAEAKKQTFSMLKSQM